MYHSTKHLFLAAVTAVYLFGGMTLLAQETRTVETRVDELETKLDAALEALAAQPAGGEVGGKIHFHGYGELHYNNTDKSGKDDEMDFHRAVIGLSYQFTDWIILDMEVDFEHAATEMELEYAHVSFLLSDALNFRAGSMLMPVGYLNEFHEPTHFYSVERPYVQKYVIPTTWQEGGAGIFGTPVQGLNYRAYVVGGLNAADFKASSGIRKGRGKVAEAISNNLAAVGRLEYTGIPGVGIGVSGYVGNAGQDDPVLDDTRITVAEVDVRWRRSVLELTGLFATVKIDDTAKLNALTEEVIGEEIRGWYLEGAVHLGDLFLPEDQNLVAFVRHEQFNTQEEVATGFAADPANDRQVTIFGLAYFPTDNVAIKADVESWEDETGEDWRQVNLGLAYEY